MTLTAPDWPALQAAIAGEVVLPGAPGYDAARRPAIARFHDVRPAAVVRCATPADVAETIAVARAAGLALAARSGGHCFAGRSSTDGIVVDVGPMDAVTVGADGVAAIGAGARLGAVYDALDAHGLTIPAGCGPEVGVAGLTLGGGLGLLGRLHGLTSDALLGAEVVLADGRVVECDADGEEDLFWALRGAGAGGFGIVTSLRFATLPAPAATRLHLTWPFADAAALVAAWQEWAPDAPGGMAATLLVETGNDPAEPPAVTLTGAHVGPEAEAAALLDDLASRAGAHPADALLDHAPYREVKRALAGLGGPDEALEEGHAYSRSELFAGSLTEDAIAALLEHLGAGRVAGQARQLDLTPLGGAYGRVAPDATAFAHRDARFSLKHTAVVGARAADGERRAARGWLERSFAIAHPAGSGGVYPNFPEPELGDDAWPRAYHGASWERLVAVKGRYDPDDVLRGRQTVPPPAGRAAAPIG
jgi:FAD/FMN-containing dehydrogenase